MDWSEICDNKTLANLPYKIETDEQGRIMMTPARGRHGLYQSEISHLLHTLLPHGRPITEVPIDTAQGTKVPDVGWYTRERLEPFVALTSYPVAPEICVEVLSPGNSTEEIVTRRGLYFDKGALEFWTCDDEGSMTFYDRSGKLKESKICPQFPAQLKIDL